MVNKFMDTIVPKLIIASKIGAQFFYFPPYQISVRYMWVVASIRHKTPGLPSRVAQDKESNRFSYRKYVITYTLRMHGRERKTKEKVINQREYPFQLPGMLWHGNQRGITKSQQTHKESLRAPCCEKAQTRVIPMQCERMIVGFTPKSVLDGENPKAGTISNQ